MAAAGAAVGAGFRPLTAEPTSNVYQPLVEEIVAGRRNIFLTGRAGTGKTTLLRQLIFNSLDKAIVLAPPGSRPSMSAARRSIPSSISRRGCWMRAMPARSATSGW